MLLFITLSILVYLVIGLGFARLNAARIHDRALSESQDYSTEYWINRKYDTTARIWIGLCTMLWPFLTIALIGMHVLPGMDKGIQGFVLAPIESKRKEYLQVKDSIDFWDRQEHNKDEDPDTWAATKLTLDVLNSRLKELEKYK